MRSGRLSPSCCQFGDILDIWPEPHKQHFLDAVSGLESLEEKTALAATLPPTTHGWCYAPSQHCPCGTSDARAQGVPCIDWSAAGLSRGISGPYFPTAVASGAKARRTRARALVVENVPQFPKAVAEACYGPDYTWTQFHVDPSMVGFEMIARPRTRASSSAVLALK